MRTAPTSSASSTAAWPHPPHTSRRRVALSAEPALCRANGPPVLCRCSRRSTASSSRLQLRCRTGTTRRSESPAVPAAGPIEGGTVIRVDGEGFGGGVGFTHNHTCRFRTTLVSAVLSTVGGQAIFTCVSPAVTPAAPASGLSAPLELTLNGQNFSSDSVRFSFQPVPVVSRLSPLTGPSAGATRVLVHGAHLGGGFSTRCLFRNTSADEDRPGLPARGERCLHLVRMPRRRSR